MARKVKCFICGKLLEKNADDVIYYEKKKRYACEKCFKSKEKELKEKEKSAQHYKELIEYICILYDIEAPTMIMVSQIKNFKEEYNYRYKGMELSLRYFYELMGNDIKNAQGVGIIPHVYKDAKDYHIHKLQLKKVAEDTNFEQIKNNKTIINISTQKSTSNYNKEKTIDMNDL